MATTFVPDTLVRPDERGPYGIGNVEFPFWTGGPGFTLAKISYPAREDGWLATADRTEGSYPAIVLAPATWTGANLFDWFTEYVVRHGYIVFRYFPENILALDPHTHADTVIDAIDKLIDINDDRINPLRGLIHEDAFGAAGVSLGGAGALMAAARDSRIRAVVGFAPGRNLKQPELYEGIDAVIRGVRTPTLIVTGQNDKISPGSGLHYLDLVPQGYKAYVEIAGGNHVQFLDPGDIDIKLPGLPRDGKAGITYAEQHATAVGYATAFYHAALKGYGRCETHVSGEDAMMALKNGLLSDLRSVPGPLPLPLAAAGTGVVGVAARTAAVVPGLTTALLHLTGAVRGLAQGVERMTAALDKRIKDRQ